MFRKQRPTFDAALISANVLKEQFISKILKKIILPLPAQPHATGESAEVLQSTTFSGASQLILNNWSQWRLVLK